MDLLRVLIAHQANIPTQKQSAAFLVSLANTRLTEDQRACCVVRTQTLKLRASTILHVYAMLAGREGTVPAVLVWLANTSPSMGLQIALLVGRVNNQSVHQTHAA